MDSPVNEAIASWNLGRPARRGFCGRGGCPGLVAVASLMVAASVGIMPAAAQVPGELPGASGAGVPGIPSIESTAGAGSAPPAASASPLRTQRTGGAPALPTDAGQYWEQYDLRPYTKELTSIERPHQAVVDWVLRDTGTDVWFTEPFGFLSADRDTLRVYHNDQMQQVVKQIYERFVNGTTVPQQYGLRLVAIGNPNWRTRAHTLLRSVPAQAPGVQAFLASKENHAILISMLRGRSDYRELAAVSIVVHNGQSQVLEQVRSRNYVQEFKPSQGTWPPYLPSTGEIQEGYRMQVSPLLSLDNQSIDLVVKCNIDQVERFANVPIELPLAPGQSQSGQINVPQVSSWRLHERFRWPADDVLILSCGVVAAPQSGPNNTLLGQGSSLFGIDRILPTGGARADALLIIEYLGDASRSLSAPPAATASQPMANPVSRGRY
jgi:hypothetical protein